MKGLNGKVSDLEKAASQRKAKLDENSAILQFNWKADVVESWIGTRGLGTARVSFSPGQMVFFSGEETNGMWAYQRPSPLGRPLTAGNRVLRQRAGPQRRPRPVWALTKPRSWASHHKGHTSRTSLRQHCPLSHTGPECVVQAPGKGTCTDFRTHVTLAVAVA